jgi:hypothetical protein
MREEARVIGSGGWAKGMVQKGWTERRARLLPPHRRPKALDRDEAGAPVACRRTLVAVRVAEDAQDLWGSQRGRGCVGQIGASRSDTPRARGTRLEEELSNGVRAKGEQAGVSRGTSAVRRRSKRRALR